MPSPVRYGWKQFENNEFEIEWGSQPPPPEDVLELLACHCFETYLQSQCHCLQNSLPCTDAYHLFDCKTSQLFIILMAMLEMSVATMTKAKRRTNESVFM